MKAAGIPANAPVRAAAIFLAMVFLLLVARFWHPVYGFTRFLQLDATNDEIKISAFRTHPVYVYRDTGGYDGLYYAQIAYDPTLTNPELAPAMDNLSYRGRRILPPALAWLFAAGRPAWIAHTYSLLNVAAWLGLAFILWRLLAVTDWRGLAAWAGVLFSAGALGSVRFALTDLIALAFLAAAMLAAEQGRPRTGTGLIAAAALSRETSVLALAGVVQRPWFSRVNFRWVLPALLPLVAWFVYLRWQLGRSESGWANFSAPFSGLVGKLSASLAGLAHPGPGEIGPAWATLAATFSLMAQAVFFVVHRRKEEAWWRVGAIYIGLMVCLGPSVWAGFPGAATRVLLPLTLAFNVLAVRGRAAPAWLAAGNLGIFSGLLMITDVHHDTRELEAARIGGASIVARAGEGWYGVEHSARHTWSWNGGRGVLALEVWPQDGRDLRLTCTLRSLNPLTVTIAQGGALRWRGTVGPVPAPIAFPVTIIQGGAQLEFSTDSPGTQEAAALGGRRLAFAVYDLRFELPETSR